MENIDYLTLALVLAVVYVINAMVFFVMLKISKQEKGIKIWLLSSVVSIIGFAALFLRDVLVPYGQVVGTYALLTSTYLIIEGVLRFRNVGSPKKRKWFNLVFIIVFLIVAVLTFDNATTRYLIMDAMLLIMCPIIIYFFVKGTKGTERWLSYIFAVAFAVEGVWFAIRWSLALSDALGSGAVTDHPFMGTIFFASIIWLLMYIFSILLIISYRSQAKLQSAADKDALTNLYNRRKLDSNFNTLIDKDATYEKTSTFYLLDVNGFKLINDTFGHTFGDKILVELAKKIQTIIRTQDFAYRLGGDEFIIVLKGTDGDDAALKAKERIKKTIEEPFESEDCIVQIKIAIGFVTIDDPKITLDEILIKADKSMYCDKNLNYETTSVTGLTELSLVNDAAD